MSMRLNQMMSYNIKDYVGFYNNFIDQETLKNLVDQLKDLDWQTHTFYQASTKQNISYDKELSVAYTDHIPEAKELQDRIWFVIQQYIKDHSFKWFDGWNGYTKVRFNRYDTGTQMKLHCDHIHSMFDGSIKGIPVLSILGALNDDYEGGDLVFWESEKINLKAGEVMIFPSNFMYPHRVDEVIKGTRYSFVSWVW